MKKPKVEFSTSPQEPTPLNAPASLERLELVGRCYGIAKKGSGFVAVAITPGSPGYEMTLVSEEPESFFAAKKVALAQLTYTETNL